MWKQSQSEEELRQLLDLVGLRYAVGRDDQGFPTANFRFAVEPDAKPVRFTAVLHEPVLIISAYQVFPATDDHLEQELFQLNELNSRWPRGNVHLDPDSSSYRIQVGIYLGLGENAQVAVREGILAVRDASRWIRSGWWRVVDPNAAFDEFLQLQNLHIPITTNLEILTSLKQYLADNGIQIQSDVSKGVLTGRFSTAGSTFDLKISSPEGRILQVETSLKQSSKPQLLPVPWEKLQELNHRLDAGAVAWSTTASHINWQVGLPLAWTSVDTSLAYWIVQSAQQVNNQIMHSLDNRPTMPY